MKNFDSRTYSINDFLEWHSNKQLEFNVFFQRRPVWSPSAKSFLMDTIIRGKPMPKVFLRQKMEPRTKKSIREVVDGQQRLRTIISFMNDGFVISKRHNPKYGGLKYSQLSQVDEDIQSILLNYEISTDLLVDMSDSEVLDVFGRLNSYAVVLNEQERINSTHFGPFKVISAELGHRFVEFFKVNKILSQNSIIRMGEVTLASELIISMIEGVQDKKLLKHYYQVYESEFNHGDDEIDERFTRTIQKIEEIFGHAGLASTEFRRYHLFYSLFGAIYHFMYHLPNLEASAEGVDISNTTILREVMDYIDNILQIEDPRMLSGQDGEFYDASKEATTVKRAREIRVDFIVRKIHEAFNDRDPE